jgi:hypothetical protein
MFDLIFSEPCTIWFMRIHSFSKINKKKTCTKPAYLFIATQYERTTLARYLPATVTVITRVGSLAHTLSVLNSMINSLFVMFVSQRSSVGSVIEWLHASSCAKTCRLNYFINSLRVVCWQIFRSKLCVAIRKIVDNIFSPNVWNR